MARAYESLSDNELVDLSRAGEDAAFAELWRRHVEAGRRYARSITREADSEDIVSEAFAKIFSLIKRGKGPTNGFRAYLGTSIRHTAEGFGRFRRETPIDFVDDFADESTSDDSQLRELDRSLTMTAFRSLPQRWQEALWYSEVEGLSVKETALIFGIKPSAMAMLTFRAREGLREAWIQAHIAEIPHDPETSEHRWTLERLGAYARNKLPRLQQQLVEAHLAECESCSAVADEARFVGSRLALALLGPVIGIGAATTLLAGGGERASAAGFAPGTPTPRRPQWRPSSRTIAVVAVTAAAAAAIVIAAVSMASLLGSPTSDNDPSHADGAGDAASPSPSATPSPSESPVAGPTLTVASDTGDLGVFYPVLTGRARPGSIVQVAQGDAVISQLTVPDDGRWSAGQLALTRNSAITVTSTLGTSVEQRSVGVSFRRPTLRASSVSGGVKLSISGVAGAPFIVRVGGDSLVASTLDATGRWTSIYPTSAIDTSALVARYQAGDRFGPSVRVQ